MGTSMLEQPTRRGPGQPPRDPNRRRLLAGVVAVVALVALAVAAFLVVTDDDGDVETGTGSTTSTSVDGTSSSTRPSSTAPSSSVPTSGPPAEVIDPTVLWPFPGTSTRYATPDDAARSFATEVLHFRSPVLGAFRAGDSRSGEVPIRPVATGPETTVLVRQVGTGDDWSVLGAVTGNIEVTAPAAFTGITSPVRVAGRALAFEGTVQVEVRADGNTGPIGAGFVTGGGDVLRPFEGTIPFETPGAPNGALVFFTTSGEDGQVWEAAAFRVSFRSTDIQAASCGGYRAPRLRPGPDQMEVTTYATCDAEGGVLRPVYRVVDRTPRVLGATLDSLLAGLTTEEREATLSSWFSPDTEGMLRSVRVEERHAVVDFDDLRPVIPNASTSAGSALLLAQLDATVFQFRSVDSVEYRLEGSCEAFTEWLQFGGCDARTRPASAD